MREKKHHAKYGAQASSSIRLVEAAGIGGTGRVLCGDSWFGGVKAAVGLWKETGTYFIGPVKTCHAKFPKLYLQSKFENNSDVSHGVHVAMTTECEGSASWQLAG